MCTKTKKSVVLTNNNSYEPGSQLLQAQSTALASSSKAIWSPASSCEEENRNQLSCAACHRSFGSPTKLELHLRKVHPASSPHQHHHHSAVNVSHHGSTHRKERLFKVCVLSKISSNKVLSMVQTLFYKTYSPLVFKIQYEKTSKVDVFSASFGLNFEDVGAIDL